MHKRASLKNKIIPSMRLVDFSDMVVPLVVIYNRPEDFPDRIVARVWEGSINRPTNICCLYPDVDGSRKDLQAAGFELLMVRDLRDEPCIVETWIKK